MLDHMSNLRAQYANVLGFQPGRVFCMCGMRRSGNRAIAAWILRNAKTGSVFLNNCVPGKCVLVSFRGLEINGIRHHTDPVERNLKNAATKAGLTDGALLLVSCEDTFPALKPIGKPLSFDLEIGLSDHILIYRSFLDWSASLLEKLHANVGYSTVSRTAILLKAIETYTRLLNTVASTPCQAINYDRWCIDPDARCTWLDRLYLARKDNSFGAVQPYGGGSFLDDANIADEDLETHQSWRAMREDPDFLDNLRLASRDHHLVAALQRQFPDDLARLIALVGDTP